MKKLIWSIFLTLFLFINDASAQGNIIGASEEKIRSWDLHTEDVVNMIITFMSFGPRYSDSIDTLLFICIHYYGNVCFWVCNTTINSMINLMQIVMPILITFLVVMGFPMTSTVMTPIFMGGVTFINIIFKNFLFISITIGFSILVINNISKSIKLKKLSSFIKQINLITIGAVFTIYLALVSMQGMYVKSLDGFAVKSTKFAIGNFIPVVGGFVSDSFDIILSSSQLIKN